MTAMTEAELQEQLDEIGPWVLVQAAQGIYRAERTGTARLDQAASSARGLVLAVRQAEEREQRQQQTASGGKDARLTTPNLTGGTSK